MSGATYAKNIGNDVGPLTVERYARDGIAVIEHVLRKLGAKKVVLMGASWGSQLGLIVADRRPDLIAAYVRAPWHAGRGHTRRAHRRQSVLPLVLRMRYLLGACDSRHRRR